MSCFAELERAVVSRNGRRSGDEISIRCPFPESQGLLPSKRQVGPNVVERLESEIDERFARAVSAEYAAGEERETAERAVHQVSAAGGRTCP
jgi:hypothetical protein